MPTDLCPPAWLLVGECLKHAFCAPRERGECGGGGGGSREPGAVGQEWGLEERADQRGSGRDPPPGKRFQASACRVVWGGRGAAQHCPFATLLSCSSSGAASLGGRAPVSGGSRRASDGDAERAGGEAGRELLPAWPGCVRGAERPQRAPVSPRDRRLSAASPRPQRLSGGSGAGGHGRSGAGPLEPEATRDRPQTHKRRRQRTRRTGRFVTGEGRDRGPRQGRTEAAWERLTDASPEGGRGRPRDRAGAAGPPPGPHSRCRGAGRERRALRRGAGPGPAERPQRRLRPARASAHLGVATPPPARSNVGVPGRGRPVALSQDWRGGRGFGPRRSHGSADQQPRRG